MIARIEKWLWTAAVGLIGLRLWLIYRLPLDANTYATYDDFLFLRLADSLRRGDWLGRLEITTLIKGPFYPLWIALVDRLNISLLFSEQLVYVLGCVLLAAALRPVFKNPGLRLALLAGVLFNPVSFSYSTAFRVTREGLYPALTLVVMACALGLALRPPSARLWPWSLGLGLGFGAFWLTREEGVWILPALALLFGGLLLSDLRSAGLPLPGWAARRLHWPSSSASPGLAARLWRSTHLPHLGLTLAAALILPLIVFSQNSRHYGLFNKTELDDGDFRAAYGALLHVRSGELLPHVPVSIKTRRLLYKVSPAFAELRPALEGESGKTWAKYSENTPENEGQISGGLFIWAFREAVRIAGYYKDGQYPREYYRRLAAEIGAACSDGRLDCYPLRATLTPPLHRAHLPAFFQSAYALRYELTHLGRYHPAPGGSYGLPDDLRLYADLTGDRISGDDHLMIIQGSAFFTDKADNTGLEVTVTSTNYGRLPVFSTRWLPSPDLYARLLADGRDYPAARSAAFEVQAYDHPKPRLTVYESGLPMFRLSLEPDRIPQEHEEKDIYLAVDKVTRVDIDPARSRRDAARQSRRIAIAGVYQAVTAPLAWLALLATAWISVQALRRRTPWRVWLVIVTLLAGVVLRIALLALIDATSFPTTGEGYIAPAHPLMYAWIILSLAAAAGSFRRPAARPVQPTAVL